MRRFLTALLTAALLTVPMAAPVAAGGDKNCTKGNVNGFAEGTIAIAKQSDEGRQLKGTSGAWAHCQFRFYDDNGPATHVFSDDEWFLGGIFGWFTDDEIDAWFGGSRKAAADAMASFEGHKLEWRQISPNRPWTVLPLTQTSVKAAEAPLFGDVFRVIQHWYHIFEPGSVSPGRYEWRWTFHLPPQDPVVVVGRVDVVAG